MTIVTFDVTVEQEQTLLQIEARRGGDVIKSRLLTSEITTLEELAAWLINQAVRTRTPVATLQKRLTVTFHTEETEEGSVRIVDDVTAVDLPEDAGQVDFRGLPGWATWTGDEAAAWIDANVIDLASAKTALRTMARAIVALRDIVVEDVV